MNLTTLLFPTILIVLNILASGVYFFYGDMKMGVYWFSAGLLNIAVTYM